jgi:hypothetical protein
LSKWESNGLCTEAEFHAWASKLLENYSQNQKLGFQSCKQLLAYSAFYDRPVTFGCFRRHGLSQGFVDRLVQYECYHERIQEEATHIDVEKMWSDRAFKKARPQWKTTERDEWGARTCFFGVVDGQYSHVSNMLELDRRYAPERYETLVYQ